MVVNVAEFGGAAVGHPDDLEALKVIANHPVSALPIVGKLLGEASTRIDAQHAWIRIGWLRENGGIGASADWFARFDQMIAYARKQGWVDDPTDSVRAHIEWRGRP